MAYLSSKNPKKVPSATIITETNVDSQAIVEQQDYIQETTFEAKPSLWQEFKNSKIVRAATLIFRVRIKVEIPDNALPEGRGE